MGYIRPEAGIARWALLNSLDANWLQKKLVKIDTSSRVHGVTRDRIDKDFGSMNMDELPRSIWTTEESQAMASAKRGPNGWAWYALAYLNFRPTK